MNRLVSLGIVLALAVLATNPTAVAVRPRAEWLSSEEGCVTRVVGDYVYTL